MISWMVASAWGGVGVWVVLMVALSPYVCYRRAVRKIPIQERES